MRAGHRLHELDLPGDSIIPLIHRGEPASVPHHDSTLQVDDIATVAGERDSVEETTHILNESYISSVMNM